MNYASTVVLATLLGMALCAACDYIESGRRKYYRDPWPPREALNVKPIKPRGAFKRFVFGYWRELSIIAGIVLAMIVIVWLAGCRMVAL